MTKQQVAAWLEKLAREADSNTADWAGLGQLTYSDVKSEIYRDLAKRILAGEPEQPS